MKQTTRNRNLILLCAKIFLSFSTLKKRFTIGTYTVDRMIIFTSVDKTALSCDCANIIMIVGNREHYSHSFA